MPTSSQNAPDPSSERTFDGLPSATVSKTGTKRKNTAFANGSADQIYAMSRQSPVPRREKNSVDSPITATLPQQ